MRSALKPEELRHSAVTLIKYLLAERKSEVVPRHLQELLNVLLWKITEAGGKYKTRFQSRGARDCNNKASLRHDHVYQRRIMVADLQKAGPHEVDEILKMAIGCTVTREEHTRLCKFDKECNGWDRYRRAGIVVVDTRTGKRVDFKNHQINPDCFDSK